MKESRLFKIIYYILENGRITAPELAEKFEVSVRTIYRDIDVISSAGIPIYVTTGRNGGIQILENYVLDKAFFSEKEKQDILSALQSVLAVNDTYEKDMYYAFGEINILNLETFRLDKHTIFIYPTDDWEEEKTDVGTFLFTDIADGKLEVEMPWGKKFFQYPLQETLIIRFSI